MVFTESSSVVLSKISNLFSNDKRFLFDIALC